VGERAGERAGKRAGERAGKNARAGENVMMLTCLYAVVSQAFDCRARSFWLGVNSSSLRIPSI
jgi:hypothetical protein